MRSFTAFLSAVFCAALPALAQGAPGSTLSAAELAALDDAARTALTRIQMRSVRENREFCGYLRRDASGQFITDKPARGEWAGCSLRWGNAHDGEIIASFHTHSAYTTEADSEVPSVLDLTSDMDSDLIGYISTPGGRFWRTNVPEGTAVMLCGRGCLIMDPDFEEDPSWGPIRKIYSLRELRTRHGE